MCDGVVDCPDGSDEQNCNQTGSLTPIRSTIDCKHPNRTCTDKVSNQTICLDIKRFCDNRIDCLDESDEGQMCSDDLCFFSECQGNCHNVPYDPGFVCYCTDGLSLAVDGVSCTDAHPCQQWGVCSQICTPLKHSYKCSCAENFLLDSNDNFTCKSVLSSPPLLIYSNRHEIRSINLQNEYANLLLSGLKNSIALDYLFSEEQTYIFWTGVFDDKIYRGELLSNTITNIETVVENGLTAAEGLAVDWIAFNLYWVESNLDQIEVSRLDGSSRKTLITGNLSSPRAIALDPHECLLFWSDWDSESARIEAAFMDGTERKVITYVSPGSWPNGISLDLVLKRIYWVDAKTDTLSTIRYDGKDLRNVLLVNPFLVHPFAVNLYENFVYWSDWKTNSLVQANKWNGSNLKVIARTLTQPFDVKIIHPSKQPPLKIKSKCSINNGGCSNLCLLTKNNLGYSCHCPHTMRLDVDGKTCILNEVFLLISKFGDIHGIDLDRPNHFVLPPISLPKVLNPIKLEYLSKRKLILWIDSQLNEVKRFSMTTSKIETVIDSVIQQPVAFAVDYITENIFIVSKRLPDNIEYNLFEDSSGMDDEALWDYDEELEEGKNPSQKHHHQKASSNDRGLNSEINKSTAPLYVCNLNGEFISQLYPKQNFTNPQSLTVDPVEGWIYWSEYEINAQIVDNKTVKTYHSLIMRSSMDGSNPQILSNSVHNPLLNQATNLQLDLFHNRTLLFWINLGTNTIQLMRLDQKERPVTTIYPEQKKESMNLEPISLTIYGSRLFVLFLLDGSIRTMDKLTGEDIQSFQNVVHDDLIHIRLYDSKLQKGFNKCLLSNGNCSHLCVMVNSEQRKCLCAMGFQVDPDDETKCVGEQEFLIYSWNWGLRAIPTSPTNQTNPREHSLLPPISKVLMASSIDFDSRSEILFWADSDEGSISSVHRDTSNFVRLVNNVDKLVDFAYDWNSLNLYWIEEQFGLIEVMKVNQDSRLVIIANGIRKPTSISLHPETGSLFWSDVGHPNVRIERSLLDGSNRTIIYEASKLNTINDLAVDLENHYLYFSDSSEQSILRLNLDSSITVAQVVLSKIRSPISLTVYENNLFWVDINYFGGAIFSIDVDLFQNGTIVMSSNQTKVTVVKSNIGDHVKNINVYHRRQQYPKNPCNEQNGGCEDFCFYTGGISYHCACSFGYVSPVDHKSCVDYEIFLLYSKINVIDSIRVTEHNHTTNAANSPYRPIVHSNIRHVIGLTYDFDRSRVIYSDIQKGTINWCHFNGTDHLVLLNRLGPVEGVVYDPKLKYLFWTSNTDSSVSKIDLSDVSSQYSNRSMLNPNNIVEIVKLHSEDRLRGIAVDSCRSRVYWTNWNTRVPSIQRAYINGAGLQSIITTNILMPNSIALDLTMNHLYWSDARYNKIEKCDLDGIICLELVSKTAQHPFGLYIFREHLYWTDWAAHSVFRCNKHTGNEVIALQTNINRPMGIVVVSPTIDLDCITTSFNPCTIVNGGCDDICHAKNDSVMLVPECSCFEGRVLDKSGRRCSSINSTCIESDGLFECKKSSNCIPIELTCDGINNCLNGSDEDKQYCATRQCPVNYHQCVDNRCINKDKVCDGVVHCNDGSDELNCNCDLLGKFKCTNGICISEMLRCNNG